MYIIVLLWVGAFLLARDISGYNSGLNKGNYITIHNTFLRKLLLPKKKIATDFKKRPKEDLNKITVFGLIFYLFLTLIILSAPVLIFLIPQIPITPYEVDTRFVYIYVDTLNEKLLVFFTEVLLFLEGMYTFISLWKMIKYQFKKATQIFLYIMCALILIVMFLGAAYSIKEIIFCFVS